MLRFLMATALSLTAWTVFSQEAENAYNPPSSEPTQLFNFNDTLYFVADDGIRGNELRRLNSETLEVELVADVTPGSAGSTIDRLHSAGGLLWFRVSHKKVRGELWVSDGVPGGRTECVWTNPDPKPIDGLMEIVGMIGGRLIFTFGVDRSSQTYMVYDIARPEAVPLQREPENVLVSDTPSWMAFGDVLYLAARDRFGMGGLWRTDGTPAGTRFLHPFKNDPKIGVSLGEAGLLLIAETEEHGIELWITQGEPENTRLVKDIHVGHESSQPSDLALGVAEPASGPPVAYFAATDPEHGRELWLTDGTESGTVLAQDLVPGKGSSNPYFIFPSTIGIYLVANTLEMGKELWVAPELNGRYAPLVPSVEGFVGPESGEPYAMCLDVSGALYYSLHEPDGEEFWFSSTPADSAHQLLDINPKGISEPYGTTRVGDVIYFSAFDPVHGRELWRTQGPNRPPSLVKDLKTDESVNPSSSPSEMEVLGERLLFAANDIVNGNELWVSDGTEGGTVLLKDIAVGLPSSNPAQITAVGNLAYFRAESINEGIELWKTDGTPEGTVLVSDIFPNKESSNPDNLTSCGGILFFTAYRPQEGNEVWVVRPGQAPDVLKSVYDGPESSYPHDFVVWKDLVFFVADDGVHGDELWRSDGTKVGTVMVRDIVMGPYEPIAFYRAKPAGEKLYFSGKSADRGQELWVMNTGHSVPQLVRDIAVPEVLDTRAHP